MAQWDFVAECDEFSTTRKRVISVRTTRFREIQMQNGERKVWSHERIDLVTIATPNHTHFPIAKPSPEAGINFICDKPMTF
jgi:predicted dehydrogenase